MICWTLERLANHLLSDTLGHFDDVQCGDLEDFLGPLRFHDLETAKCVLDRITDNFDKQFKGKAPPERPPVPSAWLLKLGAERKRGQSTILDRLQVVYYRDPPLTSLVVTDPAIGGRSHSANLLAFDRNESFLVITEKILVEFANYYTRRAPGSDSK